MKDMWKQIIIYIHSWDLTRKNVDGDEDIVDHLTNNKLKMHSSESAKTLKMHNWTITVWVLRAEGINTEYLFITGSIFYLVGETYAAASEHFIFKMWSKKNVIRKKHGKCNNIVVVRWLGQIISKNCSSWVLFLVCNGQDKYWLLIGSAGKPKITGFILITSPVRLDYYYKTIY